jgi:phosphate transport system permease protein
LDHFSQGIDTEFLANQTKDLYRRYGEHLRSQEAGREQYARSRAAAKEIRDHLLEALDGTEKASVLGHLDALEKLRNQPLFEKTAVEDMFKIADQYRQTVQTVDLSRREEYAQELAAVKEELFRLFGPRPGQERVLAMESYGATRWDIAQKHLHQLIWQEKWLPSPDGQKLEKILIRRDDPERGSFAGTELAPLFALVEEKLADALNPQLTFYWQYFIDDSTPGHYFGGVGPEVLGTLLLTLLAMAFAVPLGVISAAYLAEYAGNNRAVRLIRICINTLAGVPSIVYGLFGLAFFVTYVTKQPCILSASLTLGLLVLPVIIRASEEAIRAVPQTYREAAMGLGAGKFRTFVTVTMPAAGPGILTGIILSLSRAAGETAPILFAGAVALGPVPDFTGAWWLQPTRALSYGCHDITVGDKLAAMVPHNQFGMVMTLIVLVLCLNTAAILIRSRMSQKLRGA